MKKLLIIFLILVCGWECFGATYYISNNGSDGANGATTSTPWRSFERLNNTGASAGDIIYIDNNSTFRESLNANEIGSGELNNVVTIDGKTWGDGTKAKILGSDPVGGYDLSSDASLKLWYKFEEDSGNNRIDSSSTGYDLTDGTTTARSTDKKQGSYSIDFDSDSSETLHADHSSNVTLNGLSSFTFCFWVKPDNNSPADNETIVSKWGAAGQRQFRIFRQSTSERLAFSYTSNGTDINQKNTTDGIDDGVWSFCAIIFDGKDIRFYIWPATGDINALGESASTDLSGQTFFNSTASFTIGSYSYDSTPVGFFDGLIDEFLFFERSLDEWELRTIFKHTIEDNENLWTVDSGSRYKIAWYGPIVGEENPRCFINDIDLGNMQASASAVDSANEWFVDDTNNLLYLQITGGGSPVGTDVDCTFRSNGIDVDGGVDYQHYSGFEIYQVNETCVQQGSGTEMSGLEYSHMFLHDGAHSAFGLGRNIQGVIVRDFTATMFAHAAIVINNEETDYPDEVKIYNGIIYNVIRQGIALELIHDADIYNMVIYNINDYGDGVGAGIQIGSGDVDSLEIYSCTISDCDSDIIAVTGSSPKSGSITLKNNIYSQTATGEYLLDIAPDTIGTTFVFDYNCYYKPSGDIIDYGNDTYSNSQFATYQSEKSQDANSYFLNPLLTSAYKIITTSPAYQTGTHISGFHDTIYGQTDYFGNPAFSPYSIGAHQGDVTSGYGGVYR